MTQSSPSRPGGPRPHFSTEAEGLPPTRRTPLLSLSGGHPSRPLEEEAPLTDQSVGQEEKDLAKSSVAVKVAIVGEAGIGKTSLMIKYVHGDFESNYPGTMGINCTEKSIYIRGIKVTFSIWDLGGQKSLMHMLPVCALDTTAILYAFDLVKPSSIKSTVEWFRQTKQYNPEAIPIVVGTKFDEFLHQTPDYQTAITEKARKLARALGAPLIFCSSAASINIKVIFKVIIIKAFGLQATLAERHQIGEPIVEYAD